MSKQDEALASIRKQQVIGAALEMPFIVMVILGVVGLTTEKPFWPLLADPGVAWALIGVGGAVMAGTTIRFLMLAMEARRIMSGDT